MDLALVGDKEYGGWVMDVQGLGKDSVMYSFGAGDNISWDLEMVRRFGCKVYLFDPDPLAAAYLSTLSLPSEIIFYPIGLGTYDGFQQFYDALKPGKVNKSTIKKSSHFTKLPVKKLETIMHELGHARIDVLKIDIEGSEFTVLPAVASLPAMQLLVEIHTSFYRYGWKGLRRLWGWYKTQNIFSVLRRGGFVLVNVRDEDFTFVKEKV